MVFREGDVEQFDSSMGIDAIHRWNISTGKKGIWGG